MKYYPVGASVEVSIPLQDLNGDPVAPTGLSWTVEDGTGAVIAGPTVIDISGGAPASPIAISVPGSANAATGARAVILSITTAAGSFTQEATYGVRGALRLVYLQNSFQSYAQAQFHADDLVNLNAWPTATDEQRQVALLDAFQRLRRQSYLVPYPEISEVQNVLLPNWAFRLEPRQWPLMTVALFEIYPEFFRDKLERAQVLEADYLLSPRTGNDLQALGVFSKKTGEDSIMFKSGPRPTDWGLSRRAMEELTGHLDNRVTLTRS